MMDKEHADFERIYQQIKTRLTSKVIPVEIPIGEGAGLPRRHQPVHAEGHVYKRGTKTGEYEETDIPEPKHGQLRRATTRS